MIAARIRRWGELVTFSHTDLRAAVRGEPRSCWRLTVPHVPLTPLRVLAMLGCMVTARTSAMAFNRWADRDVDAKNPRTKGRPVACGPDRRRRGARAHDRLGRAFCVSRRRSASGRWCSRRRCCSFFSATRWAKRFTWAAHAWLGLALALAPGGAWLADGRSARASGSCSSWSPCSRGCSASTSSTRSRTRLRSERGSAFGAGALRHHARDDPRAVAHVVTVACSSALALALHRGPVFFGGVALVAAILVLEHGSCARKGGEADLAKIRRRSSTATPT